MLSSPAVCLLLTSFVIGLPPVSGRVVKGSTMATFTSPADVATRNHVPQFSPCSTAITATESDPSSVLQSDTSTVTVTLTESDPPSSTASELPSSTSQTHPQSQSLAHHQAQRLNHHQAQSQTHPQSKRLTHPQSQSLTHPQSQSLTHPQSQSLTHHQSQSVPSTVTVTASDPPSVTESDPTAATASEPHSTAVTKSDPLSESEPPPTMIAAAGVTSQPSPFHMARDVVIIVSMVGGCILLVATLLVAAILCSRLKDKDSATLEHLCSVYRPPPLPKSRLPHKDKPVLDMAPFSTYTRPQFCKDQLVHPRMRGGVPIESVEMDRLGPPRQRQSLLDEGTFQEQLASTEYLYNFFINHGYTTMNGVRNMCHNTRPAGGNYWGSTVSDTESHPLSSDYPWRHGTVTGCTNSYYKPRRLSAHNTAIQADVATVRPMADNRQTRRKGFEDSYMLEMTTSFRQESILGHQGLDIALDPTLEPGILLFYTGEHSA